jgi:hypothetical protein
VIKCLLNRASCRAAFCHALCWLAVTTLGLEVLASNLDWSDGPGYRSATLPVPKSGKAGFTLLPPSKTGMTFTNILSNAKAAENQIRLNGSGVACGDVDEDGWCDLYLCGLENGNKLYRNLGGWRFEDITEAAGVACPGQYSSGAVFADVNGDGHLDLLVNGLGTGTRLFLNDGKGHFQEVPGGGLIHQYASTTLTLADIDGDGWLDLYVPNYRTTTIRTTGLAMLQINGKLELRPEDREDYQLTPQGLILESGEPHFLYRNDGHGNFQPLSWTDGTFLDEDGRPLAKTPRDWGLMAVFRDLNGDRAPDLYVCGDFHSPDRVWINDGHGHFRAIARTALRNTSTFSMAVDFADINRDGLDDFINLDMLDREHQRRIVQFSPMEPGASGRAGVLDRPQVNRNTVQLNRGDGTYAETAYYCGLEASGWTWSAVFLDVDLDGFEDLLMSTGHQFDTQDIDADQRIHALGPLGKARMPSKILMYPPLPLPRLAFRNQGNLRFEECGAGWGFNDVGVTHGLALADLDNDGDLDVVMNSLNDAVRIYRNESAAPRVAVRLRGLAPNTRGIGARILLRGGAVPLQSQEMMCGGRYLSGDDNLRVFAAGSRATQMTLEVLWRGGRNSMVTNVTANRIYEIDEAAAAMPSPAGRSTPKAPPLFENVSGLLNHIHCDEPFDDFQRQPLLPNKLSQLGPGVAWADLDGDGLDDLIIGSGKGGKLAVYRNNGQGGFTRWQGRPFDRLEARDQTAVLVCPRTNPPAIILAGSSNYEDGSKTAASVLGYDALGGKVEDLVGGAESSVGPIVLGDVRGDGNLDLFVGGRVIPGRCPEAASSRLYRNQGGRFVLDVENSKVLEQAGLVSGAVFSDLDGDGFPELILACYWGPIRVFHNDHGRLTARDIPVTLANSMLPPPRSTLGALTGWWNGVAAGDFDGDGRMDLIACNWGLNTKYRATAQHPRKLYYGDFNGSGGVETIESYYDPPMGQEVPEREFEAMASAMPFLAGVFPTHRAYAEAGIADVLGPRRQQAREVSANTLSSMVFLNRGDHFVASLLAAEAQFAPAFAAVVADFDGDGAEDVFLSQNFFDTQPQTSRADAGRGLLLRGDGRGAFQAVPGQESGLIVYGEQRGAAAGDYDGDGRMDLVVTQNGAETMLFHNVRSKPGLRIRLEGPPGNPSGIGAVVRLSFGGRFGPAREIHGGSGYWSEDSSVVLLSSPAEPRQVWIRWPGGRVTISDLPAKAREVAVNSQGELRKIR